MRNAFEVKIETHSIEPEVFDRAMEEYERYSMTETELFLESLPVEDHEPSTQYPFM